MLRVDAESWKLNAFQYMDLNLNGTCNWYSLCCAVL